MDHFKNFLQETLSFKWELVLQYKKIYYMVQIHGNQQQQGNGCMGNDSFSYYLYFVYALFVCGQTQILATSIELPTITDPDHFFCKAWTRIRLFSEQSYQKQNKKLFLQCLLVQVMISQIFYFYFLFFFINMKTGSIG